MTSDQHQSAQNVPDNDKPSEEGTLAGRGRWRRWKIDMDCTDRGSFYTRGWNRFCDASDHAPEHNAIPIDITDNST